MLPVMSTNRERKARTYRERKERERQELLAWQQQKPLLKRQRSTEHFATVSSAASPGGGAASLQLLQQLEARVGGDPALIERNRAAAAAKLDAARDAAAAEATAARELLAAIQGGPEDSLSEFTLLNEVGFLRHAHLRELVEHGAAAVAVLATARIIIWCCPNHHRRPRAPTPCLPPQAVLSRTLNLLLNRRAAARPPARCRSTLPPAEP